MSLSRLCPGIAKRGYSSVLGYAHEQMNSTGIIHIYEMVLVRSVDTQTLFYSHDKGRLGKL